MSNRQDKDRTGLFTVVGAPYVPEQHSDTPAHYHKTSEESPQGASVAGLWLAFYALVIGVTLFGKAGAGAAVRVACNYFK